MSKSHTNADVPPAEPLVEVRRGAITESRHRGHLIAVDGAGKIVAQLGAPIETITYLRSSAKPHQAIPLVTSGAADRFHLSEQELAIACGSHNGEEIHTATVARMLRKLELDKSSLRCGTHQPFDREVARRQRERGVPPDVLQNNCSGKHTGMLALALHLGASTATYDQPDSPVQLAVAHTVAQFSGVPLEDIAVGIDGCGVPVFGVTVRAMALMYARLVLPPADFGDQTHHACQRIVTAMATYPEMVGGTTKRLDTEIIRATDGRIISKVGAEGVYTAGVRPCEQWPQGLGLALKIEDGENDRARPVAAIEFLRQLGVLCDQALAQLAPYASSVVRNHCGAIVGEVRASFQVERKSTR